MSTTACALPLPAHVHARQRHRLVCALLALPTAFVVAVLIAGG